MKLLRVQGAFLLLKFVTHSYAITLLEVLQSYPQLSTLQSYLNVTANATGILANANNFTFLAPSNAAIGAFLSHNPNILTEDLLQATVQYSLLRGGYPTLSFSTTPQFVASNLVNTSYANVTGGQAVELVLSSSGTPQVITGNKSISTSTSTDIVCTGGIVHIIDEVLSVPVAAVQEVTSANLEYFISILNIGGYLNEVNSGYVNEILEVPDVTYFIPNSAAALANATELAQNSSATDLEAMFDYHIITGFVGYSSLLKNGMVLTTAQGSNLTVTIQDGQMYINSAKVIASDYIVANGVVHVIDNLLNRFDASPPLPPPQPTASTVPTHTPAASSSATGIVTGTPSHSPSSKSHHSGSAIGIGIGVTLAALLTLGALVWFIRRSRIRRRAEQAWENQSVIGFPYNPEKVYMPESPVEKQGVLGSGLPPLSMHHSHAHHVEDVDYRNSVPDIPQRSPSRLKHENDFF